MDTVKHWLRQITEVALILIALGVVLQILFPTQLAFINANVAQNLIALVNVFSGAGLIGLIAVGIVLYLLRPAR
jgi:hypothetical protein